ncbi:MAG TPA: antitoxin family protein [Fimbriiglobus sp.]|nr:antitoxin family protein [Fimbriiglobus sp.]
MISVLAVYENGVLRPKEPLALAEGQTVEITVSEPKPAESPISDDEYIRRLDAVKSIQEWVELTKLLPPDDGGYDIVKALEENRRWSEGRPPPPEEGPTP